MPKVQLPRTAASAPLLLLLALAVTGCSSIPTWTTKGWVQDRLREEMQALVDSVEAISDSTLARRVFPRDVPAGTVVAWLPDQDDWKDGKLVPPAGWALLETKFPPPRDFAAESVYLKGLREPASPTDAGQYAGSPAHSHTDTLQAGPRYAEGHTKPTGDYVIAPRGSHTHDIGLTGAPNDPPHVTVVLIVKE